MDWSKVDAGLAAALADAEADQPLAVFVHLTGSVEPQRLEEVGIPDAGHGRVLTATLTPAQVEQLTDEGWVGHLRLSRPLRPPES